MRTAADDVYAERFAALAKPAAAQMNQLKSTYGVNFENLTPEAEGLLNAGLIGGGTEGERAAALRRMSGMSPEQQKAYAQSMVYQKLSVGEREAYNQMDKTISGVQALIQRMPQDLTQNPIKYQATRLSEFLGGQRSPEYQNFISMIGNIKAPIINQTYGAAVTGSEYARALEWLPGLESQSLGTVMTNLKNLAAFSEYARDAQTSMYLGLPKPNLNTYLDKWQGKTQENFDSQEFIRRAREMGKSPEEIQEFLRSRGINFNSVGNTSASITLGSRLAKVNNNPGNLRYVGQPGAEPGEGNFARFRTPEEGVAALKRQIQLDQVRGHTIESFIAKYAPPQENDTALYIKQAVENLGVDPRTPIGAVPVEDLARFIALKESSSRIS